MPKMTPTPHSKKYEKRPQRDQIPSVLIVCEDKNIEPSYFEEFKEQYKDKLDLKVYDANGKTQPAQIIARAVNLKNQLITSRKLTHHSKTFCVFDVDDCSQAAMDRAVKEAKKNNITIILSNPCVEVWFLCHYGASTKAYQNPDEVLTEIKKKVPTYNKSKKAFTDLNSFLKFVTNKNNIEKACKNANKINKIHDSKSKYDISKNPSTNMEELIKEILNEKN